MAKTIAIFAHPNDEVPIAFTLKQINEISGTDLKVYYITSGKNGSDLTDPLITPGDLAIKREAEATAALATLGITSGQIVFMQLDDDIGTLATIAAELETVYTNESPAVIITTGPTGTYGDSEHLSAWQAIQYQAMKTETYPTLILGAEFSETKESNYSLTFTATPVPDDRIALSNLVATDSVLFTSYISEYPSQYSSASQTALINLNVDYPYEEFSIGFIRPSYSTDWEDISEAVGLEQQATNTITATGSWATLKTQIENYLQNMDQNSTFGVLRIRREDGSETSYESYEALLNAYERIKKLADRETLNRTSAHRPIKIRSSSFWY